MKRICVFLGSDLGVQTEYQSSAKQLAKEIVERDIELVYGAAKVGLMGVLADAVLELGGRVIGVVPEGLTQKMDSLNYEWFPQCMNGKHKWQNWHQGLSRSLVALEP